ncbi:metal-binding protein [Deinococcus sp. QL22]|uniref:metal-binding protein n=1 Tax=Deinococcus sp. QL22 TaxID=2939437 RepID=UPI0020180C00|nr:metal-binding protein [Deinococcus sp. QL22]UQN05863.1 metal-binding protein [Deinococcus sp. QL22]
MGGVPSGRVHNLINVAAYSVLAGGVLLASAQNVVAVSPTQAVYFSLAYAAGTFLLSPDLDLAEGHVNSKRYWGVLGFLWAPYGMIFSHRGISHTWVVGPLTRLAYLAIMVGIGVGLISLVFPGVRLPTFPQTLNVAELWPALWPLLLGYYLSQWLHLMADGVRPDHGMRHSMRKIRKRF